MPSLEQAEQQLLNIADGDLERAELLVEALEQKRRQDRYVCYWEPCGDQLQFWEKLRPHHRVWLICGGNGSGKTDLSCFLQTAWLLGKDYFRGEPAWKWVEPLPIPDHPASIRAVGLNSDMLRDPIYEKLTGVTDHPAFFPNDDSIEYKNSQNFTVRAKGGGKWQGKSADVDPKTHGGPTVDLDCLDEECSYAIYQENYQRIRKGGYLLITATPLDDVGTVAHPWIYDLILQAEAGDPEILLMFMSSLNNPYLDEDYKRKQISRWKGHPEEAARLYGRPVRRSGLYYKQWRAEPPLWVPSRELRGGFRAVMIDPAVTGTVGALWADFDLRGKMTLYREYKKKGLTVSQHVENILNENRGDPINLWLSDPFMGRQRVPDSTSRDQHKTVLQVWREAGISRLILPEIDYSTCLARSHEYLIAAQDATHPHPSVEVFDHLSAFADEMGRYVIDSVAQGPNRGELRDKPRKGKDGSSTLMECYQYLCGMGLRARPGASALPPATGGSNYFADNATAPIKAPKGFDEEPW